MSDLRRVVNNTMISLLGQAITWSSSFFLTMAYGRFLGDARFGELYLAASLVALIGVPVEYGFNQQITRDVAQAPEKAGRYLANTLPLKLGIWVVLFAALLGVSALLHYSDEERVLVVLSGFTLLSTSFASTFAALFAALHQQRYPVFGGIIERGGTALVGILLLRAGAGVTAMGVVLLGCSIANVTWEAFWFFRIVRPHIALDSAVMHALLRTSVAFLIAGVLSVLYFRIDAVLLSIFAPASVVGWYGAGYRLFDTLFFLPSIVVSSVMYPVFSKYSLTSTEQLRKAVEKTTTFLLFCGMPIATFLAAGAPAIVGFLYHRSEFEHTIPVLQWLAPGLLFMYITTIGGAVLTSSKQERKLPIMGVSALIFNLTLNFFLIPRLQHIGAAISTTLTELLLLGIVGFLVPRELLPMDSLKVALKAGVSCALMGAAVVAFGALSIFILLPIGAAIYLAAAWALGAIPREDIEALLGAVARRPMRGAPALAVAHHQATPERTMAVARLDTSNWFRMRGTSARATTTVSWNHTRRGGQTTMDTEYAEAGVLTYPRRLSGWFRRLVAATIRYTTNHVVSHVPFHHIRHAWYRQVLGWYIGPQALILTGQRIQLGGIRKSGKRVSIGAGTVIQRGCHLDTTGGLLIGENVSIAPDVWLLTTAQDYNDPAFGTLQQPIVIDSYACIGPRAMILAGMTIGEGAVVQAGAVVTRDVEPYMVVSGAPAQMVEMRQVHNPAYALSRQSLF